MLAFFLSLQYLSGLGTVDSSSGSDTLSAKQIASKGHSDLAHMHFQSKKTQYVVINGAKGQVASLLRNSKSPQSERLWAATKIQTFYRRRCARKSWMQATSRIQIALRNRRARKAKLAAAKPSVPGTCVSSTLQSGLPNAVEAAQSFSSAASASTVPVRHIVVAKVDFTAKVILAWCGA